MRLTGHLHLTGRTSFVKPTFFRSLLPNDVLRVLRQWFRPPAKAQTSGERDDGLLLEKMCTGRCKVRVAKGTLPPTPVRQYDNSPIAN